MLGEIRPLLFAALLAAVLWLSWLVLAPFVPGMVWAAVLVVTFRPLHARLSRRLHGRTWAASAIVTILVAAFVIVPVVLAAVQVVQGGIQTYDWIQGAYAESGPTLGVEDRWPALQSALTRAMDQIGLANVDVQTAALDGLKRAGELVAKTAPVLVGNAFGLVFSFLVMLAMIVVFFADGPRYVSFLAGALPVPRADADRILADLGQMTRSVFVSVGLTALCQAALATVALLVLGVPSAFTLGAAMFFASLLPAGTAIVWIPIAIYLFATGHGWKAAILTIWCAAVVGTVDNVLRPLFARGGAKLSTMALLLGMVGGLLAFGIVGVFLGPIVLYVLGELVKVVRHEVYGEAA